MTTIATDRLPSNTAANPAEVQASWPDSAEIVNYVLIAAKSAFEQMNHLAVDLYFETQRKIEQIDLPNTVGIANKACTDAEKIMNVAACLPFVGWISGYARFLLGQAQAIAGVALAVLSEIGRIMTSQDDGQINLKHKWEALYKIGIEYAIQGCLNAVRGFFESAVGTYTFGVGNILLLIPNQINQRNFAPYLAYGSHKVD